jgi:predicted RND superfamily exporter protein
MAATKQEGGTNQMASRKKLDVGHIVLRYRLLIGTILVLCTAFMAYEASRVTIGTRFVDFFPQKAHNVELYRRFHRYGGAQTLAIMLSVKQGDIFNTPTLKKIQAITYAVDRLPGVNHQEIFSLASYRVAYAEAVAGGLNTKPYMYPQVPTTAAGIKDLKVHVFAHREQLSNLISPDYKNTLITASFTEEGLDYKELFNDVEGIVRKYQGPNTAIYVAGEPIVRGYGYHFFPIIVVIFFAAIFLMIITLYWNLGNYTSWWAPIVTGTCSALFGLGFVGIMGYNFDPLMLVVPFILTARDMSHGIQWQRRYYYMLEHTHHRRIACITTTNFMLPAGLLAILADIAGIVFISFSGITVLDNIARAGTVWLAASLIMVFIFQPIMMSFLPQPRRKVRKIGTGWIARRLRPMADGLCHLPVTPGPVRGALLIGSLLFLLAGIFSGVRAQVGYTHPGTPLYKPNSKVNRDIAAISKYFPTDEGWVIIATPSYPSSQSVLGPQTLRATDDLRSYLLQDPRVRQVVTFASMIIRPFNQMFHYGYPKFYAIPKNTQVAGNLWYLYLGGTAPGEIEHYISTTAANNTCIRIMLSNHTYQTLNDIQAKLASFAHSYIGRDPQLSQVHMMYMGGIAGLYAAANQVLFNLDFYNISFVLACVFIFCMISFRSFTAGVLFVFACVLANFGAFIYLRLRQIGLTIDTVPVISLGIGLGVDYGIYVVSRILDEVSGGMKLDDAIPLAIKSTGGAVFMVMCVMIGGIIPWAFSPALFHNNMSILLAVLMLLNAIAGVFVLPSFISWSRSAFICHYERAGEKKPMRPLEVRPIEALGTRSDMTAKI